MKKRTFLLCIDTCCAYKSSMSEGAAIPDAITVNKFRTSKPKTTQKQYKPNVMKSFL